MSTTRKQGSASREGKCRPVPLPNQYVGSDDLYAQGRERADHKRPNPRAGQCEQQCEQAAGDSRTHFNDGQSTKIHFPLEQNLGYDAERGHKELERQHRDNYPKTRLGEKGGDDRRSKSEERCQPNVYRDDQTERMPDLLSGDLIFLNQRRRDAEICKHHQEAQEHGRYGQQTIVRRCQEANHYESHHPTNSLTGNLR